MIKIKNITKKSGFTKEQQKHIADVILREINSNKNIEAITNFVKTAYKNDLQKAINSRHEQVVNMFNEFKNNDLIKVDVPETTCKYEIKNDIKVLVDFLHRVGVSVTVNEVENPIYEQLRDNNGFVIELSDAYTDGNIAISKKFIGEVPEEKTIKHQETLNGFIPDNLIKSDGYYVAKNQKLEKIKGVKYQIFYKNKKDDYIVFNQKYINMLPKGCEIFFEDAKDKQFSTLIAKKDGEIVAVIMPVLFKDGLKDFDTIPEIIEEKPNVVKYPVIVHQEQKEQKQQKQQKEHTNAVTEHIYTGNNIDLLNAAMLQNGYAAPVWVGKYQARKLNKQIKQNAPGVVIKVFYEDEDGRSFCKLEKVYNVEELEPIKKVENTVDFQNMVERLKMA